MTVSTDINALTQLLALPARPEAVRFTEGALGAGADRQIIAAIDFGERIEEALSALPEDPRLNGDRGVRPPKWLDPKDFAAVMREQGNLLVIVEGARDATAFAKGAYSRGFAVRQPGSSIVLAVMQTQ